MVLKKICDFIDMTGRGASIIAVVYIGYQALANEGRSSNPYLRIFVFIVASAIIGFYASELFKTRSEVYRIKRYCDFRNGKGRCKIIYPEKEGDNHA